MDARLSLARLTGPLAPWLSIILVLMLEICGGEAEPAGSLTSPGSGHTYGVWRMEASAHVASLAVRKLMCKVGYVVSPQLCPCFPPDLSLLRTARAR